VRIFRVQNFDTDKLPVSIDNFVHQVAVSAGRVDKVKRLLEIGADHKATDLNGNTFYHLAARDGRMEIVQAFIDDIDLASVNKDGDTPLHLAAKSGHVQVVELLLQKSKLDARNR
jgi:ankyrin repeat protein